MQQVSLLTIGSVASIKNTKNYFTTLHVLNEGDDIITAIYPDNLKNARALLKGKNSGYAFIGEEKRQVFFLQYQYRMLEKSIENKQDITNFICTYGYKHSVNSHVNFFLENGQVIPSSAQIFLAKSLNNSVINSKRENFIPLPDAASILTSNPFQTRLLIREFEKAVYPDRR